MRVYATDSGVRETADVIAGQAQLCWKFGACYRKASPDALHDLVTDFSEQGWALVEAFWPGGLTLVACHQPSLTWDLGETYGTVAVRMPSHPVALGLLTETGPMAVQADAFVPQIAITFWGSQTEK